MLLQKTYKKNYPVLRLIMMAPFGLMDSALTVYW